QLTATAAGGTSHRDVAVGGTTTALRATRFPLMGVAGPVGRRVAVAAGFTTYLDKSWDVTLRDSLLLRGVLQRYTDELTSDGSVADVRLAAASRLSRRIAIGAGVHVLVGSTRMTAERRFGSRGMPIRLGARGGQMPFGPGTKAPTEVAGSLGTGRAFAQGRALVDLGLERLERRGGGLIERVWTVLVGLTVRP